MSLFDDIRLEELIIKFQEKFMLGKNIQWSIQVLRRDKEDVEYFPPNPYRDLALSDLKRHFEQRPFKIKGGIRGGLAITGDFNNKAMWFCLDCDNTLDYNTALNQFIPVLEAHGIDYIIEHSGTSGRQKCHIWFMCKEVPIPKLKVFVECLLDDSKIEYRNHKKHEYEFFPTVSKGNRLRIPGGFHCRNGKANEITYKNKTDSSAFFVLESFIEAKQVTEEEVDKLLASRMKKVTIKKPSRRKFSYVPLRLPLPAKDLPSTIKTVASNCQAINRVLRECIEDDLIEARGGIHHNTGLYLGGLAIYHDLVTNSTTGEKWVKKFYTANRRRDYDTHKWETDKDKFKHSPHRAFSSCAVWEREYDYCKGCPFRNRPDFTSPRQFITGSTVKKNIVQKLDLVSDNDVKTKTFPQAKERIETLLKHQIKSNILIASGQGAGKSYWTDQTAADLAKQGYKVLIAVPTANLAMQHAENIKSFGEKAFILMSHKNLFEKYDPGFECPEFDNIQYYEKLGLQSQDYKQKYCSKCPFNDKCPFPNQYSQVKEEDYKVVIIQHAHFKAREVMYNLIYSKGFDVLFIDESVVDNTISKIKPLESELEAFGAFLKFPWMDDIMTWFKDGGYPDKKLRPKEIDLEEIGEFLDSNQIPNNLKEYIRHFNNGEYYDKTTGLTVFYPIPNIGVRVFTDATPPLDLMKIVLDTDHIEVFGDNEHIDYTQYNKDNKVIQVLDTSMSKTSLKKDDYARLVDILEYIGDSSRKEYSNKNILITTYAEYEELVKTWLKTNYPDICNRVLVSHMAVGTNEFIDYDIQFLVAGVYLNGKHFSELSYNIKFIANYWNRLNSRPIIHNPYPFRVSDSSSIPRNPTPIKRVEKIDNGCFIVEYPGFTYWQPAYQIDNLIEQYAIAKTQQAIRLRFTSTTNSRVVYVFGNYPFPSFMITDSVIEEDLLSPIRQN
jgi:hypothetical protein